MSKFQLKLRNNYFEIITFSEKRKQFVMFTEFFLNKFLSLNSFQYQLELSFMNTYNFKCHVSATCLQFYAVPFLVPPTELFVYISKFTIAKCICEL